MLIFAGLHDQKLVLERWTETRNPKFWKGGGGGGGAHPSTLTLPALNSYMIWSCYLGHVYDFVIFCKPVLMLFYL